MIPRVTLNDGVPAVNQIEVHPYFTNDAGRAASVRRGLAVEAHGPRGSG